MNKYNSSDFFKMAGIKASIDIETYERDMKEKEKELERYKNIVDELIEYGDNCLENLKDQDNYMCESIDVVGLMQMIHIMYLDKLKELKGEKNG